MADREAYIARAEKDFEPDGMKNPWKCPACGERHPLPPTEGSIPCSCGAELYLSVEPLPMPKSTLIELVDQLDQDTHG